MNWELKFYSDEVEKEIRAMPAGFVARFIRSGELIEISGPNLGMPHTKSMSDGLFELRLKSAEGIARVFFCTLIGRKIVFLHCFIKKTQKTPPKELALARKRMKDTQNAELI